MWFLSQVFGLVAIVTQCQAHMILKYPPPIGKPNNSPLNNAQRNPGASEGGSYPCKVQSPADYESAQITPLQAGSSIPVSFLGSAVHGGGSCQFALSKDTAPTVESKFKVIHSVEGGCPARNQTGNFPEGGADFEDPDIYSVTLPDELQTGRYTFSWTWVNKIGNREFYMNCAAVQIGDDQSDSSNVIRQASTTSDGDDPFFDSLPDMVVLNTDTDDCVGTDPQGSFLYANPGNSVEINEQDIPQANMILPQCAAGGGKITQAARSPGPANPNVLPSPISTTPDSSPSETPDADPSPSSTATLAFASGSITPTPTPDSTDSVPSTTDSVPSPTDSQPSPTNSEPSPTDSTPFPSTTLSTSTLSGPPTPSDSASNCPAPSLVCTVPGFSCVDLTTFVLCGHVGDCGVPQRMAAGTVCEDGAIRAADDEDNVQPVRERRRVYRWAGSGRKV